jgi:hypothetical protein
VFHVEQTSRRKIAVNHRKFVSDNRKLQPDEPTFHVERLSAAM